MKLATLGVLLVCATLSFGQSSLQIYGPSGAVRLSANSISGVVDNTDLADLARQKLIALNKILSELTSTYAATYSAQHPKVQELKAEINRTRAAVTLNELAAAPRNDTGIVRLKENVEISTGMMTLYADEADYNTNTGEIEVRGIVRVKADIKNNPFRFKLSPYPIVEEPNKLPAHFWSW